MELSDLLQKETPPDQQLHLAALQGNVEQLKTVLEAGKIHVDSKDKVRNNHWFSDSCYRPPNIWQGYGRWETLYMIRAEADKL